MKKIIILCLVVFDLFARSDIPSSIPLPEAYFLPIENCDQECQFKYINEEKYFTFLANFDINNKQNELKSSYERFAIIFNMPYRLEILSPVDRHYAKIAVLIPQKVIKQYSKTIINSIISYLLTQQSSFEIEVFNSTDEDPAQISDKIHEIKSKNFINLIAVLTPHGVEALLPLSDGLNIFIPTVHKSLFLDAPSNILFGGIDYQAQIDKLSNFTNNKIAMFSDGSPLGTQLDEKVTQSFENISYLNKILELKNLKYMLSKNYRLQNASIFLNLPLIKTSLLSSQLRAYDITPFSLLSTQINYDPMLLHYTQFQDRTKLYIANSINESPLKIRSTNELFGHSIAFDWVNYSVNVGLDYMFSSTLEQNAQRLFNEHVEDSQIQYDIKIYKTSAHSFYEVQ